MEGTRRASVAIGPVIISVDDALRAMSLEGCMTCIDLFRHYLR